MYLEYVELFFKKNRAEKDYNAAIDKKQKLLYTVTPHSVVPNDIVNHLSSSVPGSNFINYSDRVTEIDENIKNTRDIFDNRKTNLRVCTARENTLNGKVPKNNTSGVIGVSFSKSKNKWKAFINKDYKQLFLGYYETMTDAVRARLIAERIMYGEFAPQGDLSEEFGVKVEEKECPTECTHNLQQILKEMHRAVTLGTSKAGCGEDNYLNGIIVQFDLTFSIKAWVEAERYHFLDFVSSQSTMHRIAKMDIASQCNEYVTDEVIQCVNRLRDVYNTDPTAENYLKLLYNVPVGFRLTARMTTNYRQLKTIYHQRKNHRLPEWRDFCGWIETLPHSELIIGGD